MPNPTQPAQRTTSHQPRPRARRGIGQAFAPKPPGLATALLIVAVAASACGDASPPAAGALGGSWQARGDTIGDTIVVETVTGSERGEAVLVEEVRIGREEGEDHEVFGQIGGLAVTTEGDILVYDAHATALRRYDAVGTYRGTIGRAGSGPGEYQHVAGLAVLEDGRIVLNDFGNGRFTLFSPGGAFLTTWPVRPAIAARRPLYPHPDGGLFLHDAVQGGEVLVRLDGEGEAADTVWIPHADHRQPSLRVQSEMGAAARAVPFTPRREWSVTSEGELFVTLGEPYAVDVHRVDGSVLRVGRAVEPVPVTPQERLAEEDRIRQFFERFVEGWRWDGPPIPDTKPPVSGVHAGRDGTIWVQIAQPGTALPPEGRRQGASSFVQEPIVFDVFDLRGRMVGQVRAPNGMRTTPHPVLDRNHVWAVVIDELEVESVARFRVEWEGNP